MNFFRGADFFAKEKIHFGLCNLQRKIAKEKEKKDKKDKHGMDMIKK